MSRYTEVLQRSLADPAAFWGDAGALRSELIAMVREQSGPVAAFR
jgi:hypothetical protein